ncbi:MAG: amylo-alpha-1,6-glucosidase, partial [Kiritimatiellae bacterium]|nr:amylo-alpha-1,6-glucosidase [Kiritimatiellia bacterium]
MKRLTQHLNQLDPLAIHVPAGDSAHFFYGDTIEGYFEGYTHSTAKGTGYWLDGQPLFRDLTARLGPRRLPHETALGAAILPHAIRHIHREATHELSILHRQRAIAIRLYAARPQWLGADLLFDVGAGTLQLDSRDGTWLATFAGHPLTCAISASAALHSELADPVDGQPTLSCVAQHKTRELVLYLAFDADPTQAVATARRLRDENALAAHVEAIADLLFRASLTTGDPDYDRAVAWAKLTSLFMVSEQFGKGIWAGLPWFKHNWGRDTFIALPGTLLVSGHFDDAREVILNFLRWQDTDPASPTYGRIPNRVCSPTDIIYNTADGTPWLIRELYETLQYTGDLALAHQTYPQVRLALDSAIERAVDAEGFLTHDDADTWMDARIEGERPWSARGNRANDIQALWHNALLVGERLAHLVNDPDAAQRWRTLADTLRTHFLKRFWNPQTRQLADRIDATNRRDEKVRPNQLMVISIPLIAPLLDDTHAEQVVANAISELLFPHGIASLSPNDTYFHPLHHNDDWYHFDAAYHNGTVWGWNAGPATTALCRQRQTELAARLARNLAEQILSLGCRGTMSELIEAIPRQRGHLVLSGTWAQAWSTSEFCRNAYQDFAGFQARLLDGALLLNPHIPRAWSQLDARFPFGNKAALVFRFRRDAQGHRFEFCLEDHPRPLDLHFSIELGNRRYAATIPLCPGRKQVLQVRGTRAHLDKNTPITGERLPPPPPPP